MLARVALTAFALLAIAPAAVAGTVPVTTETDSDDGACTQALCSLRDGIKYSKKSDRVEVPAGTYDLTLGELQITHDMTLAGAGSSTTTIDAGGGSRVIETTGITGAI